MKVNILQKGKFLLLVEIASIKVQMQAKRSANLINGVKHLISLAKCLLTFCDKKESKIEFNQCDKLLFKCEFIVTFGLSSGVCFVSNKLPQLTHTPTKLPTLLLRQMKLLKYINIVVSMVFYLNLFSQIVYALTTYLFL